MQCNAACYQVNFIFIFKKRFLIISLIYRKIIDPFNASIGTLLIRLKPTDFYKCDEIIAKLNQRPFPGVRSQSIINVKKSKSYDQISENNNSNKTEKLTNSPVKNQEQQEEIFDKKLKLMNKKQPIYASDIAEEVERLKKELSCVICLERQKVIISMPCHHLASCVECSETLQTCPVCKKKVEATIRTYF
jgi:hypothetical protein